MNPIRGFCARYDVKRRIIIFGKTLAVLGFCIIIYALFARYKFLRDVAIIACTVILCIATWAVSLAVLFPKKDC